MPQCDVAAREEEQRDWYKSVLKLSMVISELLSTIAHGDIII
jgi:hypothetical protein